MTSPNDDIRNMFRWSLQALAMEAGMQRGLFPPFAPMAEELACDFGDWSEVALRVLAGEFSGEQREAIREIDRRLDAMSLGGALYEEGLWSDVAVGEHPLWRGLRDRARETLELLGWPIEPPPDGRAIYAAGDHNG